LVVNVMIVSMLLAFPIAFYVGQTAGAGIGEEITVSQELTADDNSIINGDVYQASIVETGDTNSGDSSGGNSDESGENSGGSPDDSSGDGTGDGSGDGSGSGSGGDNGAGTGGSSDGGQSGGSNSGSGGTPQGNSVGSSGGGLREAIMADHLLGNPANPVVINEVHPSLEEAAKYGNERVELFNMGKNPVNVSLWYMKNMTDQVIGTIRDKEIPPYGFLVVNVTGLTGDYQAVTLFDSGNNRIDSVIYFKARSHNGSCYARIPDGADAWEWTTCTLGSSNRQR
jgi:hypothetical protein